jgi:hypothetical protein
MSERLLILTVGTSLIKNTGGEGRSGDPEVTELNRASSKPYEVKVLNALLPFLTEQRVQDELSLRWPGGTDPKKIDRLPQELSYLAELTQDPRYRDGPPLTVALIASQSYEGTLCANVICQVLKDKHHRPWNRYKLLSERPVRPIEGLRVEGEAGEETTDTENIADVFRTVGIPKLLSALQELCQGGWEEVILNFTGGFKGAIPFGTIAAAFLPCETVILHYLFHNSRTVIKLPSYPIGLNFPLWHREANLLQAYQRKPDIYAPELDARMQAVASDLAKATTSDSATLAHVMQAHYNQQLGTDPLQTYSERVILRFLGDESLRDRLLTLVRNIGPLIWLGDKLPMAADHARLHHHDLLEIAEVLLIPIADQPVDREGEDPRFLNEAERFVLLAAVLLHDCGHTLDALPLTGRPDVLVPLFRTEIRELHHFLAYHRLTSHPLAAVLQWDPELPLAKAVAWLCVYHRKRTGWSNAMEPIAGHNYCPYIEMLAPPPMTLSREELAIPEGTTVCFPKLVALLRLIDGCDNQGRRVGAGCYRKMTEDVFDQDAATWKHRLHALVPLALQAGVTEPDTIAPLLAPAWRFLHETNAWLTGSAPAEPKLNAEFWQIRRTFGSAIAAMANPLSREQVCMSLWLEVARAYDEYTVRHNQYIHFIKHEVVERVTILPEDFDTCWSFQVHLLVPEKVSGDNALVNTTDGQPLLDSLDTGKQFAAQMDGCSSVRKWVEKEIKAEFTEEAQDYLEKRAGRPVRVQFFWSDRPGTPF